GQAAGLLRQLEKRVVLGAQAADVQVARALHGLGGDREADPHRAGDRPPVVGELVGEADLEWLAPELLRILLRQVEDDTGIIPLVRGDRVAARPQQRYYQSMASVKRLTPPRFRPNPTRRAWKVGDQSEVAAAGQLERSGLGDVVGPRHRGGGQTERQGE